MTELKLRCELADQLVRIECASYDTQTLKGMLAVGRHLYEPRGTVFRTELNAALEREIRRREERDVL